MPGIIIVAGQETANNTDILQGTRLQNVPSNGVLTFELQASDAVVGTASYTVSIQLPSGDTPMNGVLVPAGSVAGLAGVLDERENLTASFRVNQGGHSVFSCVEDTAGELTWRVTFTPF